MALQIGDSWMDPIRRQWQNDDPTPGRIVSQAFQGAANRGQDQRQFDAKMAEEKRQFDILNQGFPSSWGDSASGGSIGGVAGASSGVTQSMPVDRITSPPAWWTQPGGPAAKEGGVSSTPTWMRESDETMNGPQDSSGVSKITGGPEGWTNQQMNAAREQADGLLRTEPYQSFLKDLEKQHNLEPFFGEKDSWRSDSSAVDPRPNWMKTGLDMSTPSSGIAALQASKNVAEYNKLLSEIYATHPTMVGQRGFQKAADKVFGEVARREQLELSRQTVQNRSVASQILVKDAADFNKRVGGIDPERRASIMGMSKNPDGTIAPMQWQALSYAEEASVLRKDNERRQAEIEAMQRGDQQRTVITEKGVTRTFTPAKSGVGVGEIPEPIEKTISGKKYTVLRTGPNSFQWKAPTGEEKQFTDADALALAKGYGIKSQSRAFWLEQSGGMAMQRMSQDQRTGAVNSLQRQVAALTAIPEKKRTEDEASDLFDLQSQLKAFQSTDAPTPTGASEKVEGKFTKGQRAVQNGITYEFDGTNWNPVK